MGLYSTDQEDGVSNGGLSGSVTVGTSAVEAKLGASTLSGRIYLVLQARDTGIFFGTSSGVTTSNGVELFKNQTLILPANNAIWLIADGAGKSVRVQELSSEQPN